MVLVTDTRVLVLLVDTVYYQVQHVVATLIVSERTTPSTMASIAAVDDNDNDISNNDSHVSDEEQDISMNDDDIDDDDDDMAKKEEEKREGDGGIVTVAENNPLLCERKQQLISLPPPLPPLEASNVALYDDLLNEDVSKATTTTRTRTIATATTTTSTTTTTTIGASVVDLKLEANREREMPVMTRDDESSAVAIAVAVVVVPVNSDEDHHDSMDILDEDHHYDEAELAHAPENTPTHPLPDGHKSDTTTPPVADGAEEETPNLEAGVDSVLVQVEVSNSTEGNPSNEMETTPETEGEMETLTREPVEKQRPTFIVEEESDDDNDKDAFSALSERVMEPITSMPHQKVKRKRIEIKLLRNNMHSSKKSKTAKNAKVKVKPVVSSLGVSAFQSEILPEYIANSDYRDHDHDDDDNHDDEYAQEARLLQQRLAFYAETHEEQDPKVQALLKAKERHACELELEALATQDEATRKEIADIVQLQLKEKLASTGRNIERLRARALGDEQKDLSKLHNMYTDKLASEQNKLQLEMKLLSQQHAQDMHKQMQQHRLNTRQRGIPDQMANAEWAQMLQQLQDRNNRQMQDVKVKAVEYKGRREQDYLREREKCRKHHEKRRKDMEHSMQKIIARMHLNFHQQHQRYLKRHLQRISKLRDDITARINGHMPAPEEKVVDVKEVSSSKANDNRKGLESPLPIRSCSIQRQQTSTDDALSEFSATVRHRNRTKSMNSIPGQLEVEIHNEGLWIKPIKEKQDETTKRNNDVKAADDENSLLQQQQAEFIPWGLKAREIFYTILCGEIPVGYGADRFDFGDALALQQAGGCIRCVVTDFRTGDLTASRVRAECIKQQEQEGIQELESKVSQLSQQMIEADKNVKKAEVEEKEIAASLEKALKDVVKAKKSLTDFRTKYARFFGPGKAILAVFIST